MTRAEDDEAILEALDPDREVDPALAGGPTPEQRRHLRRIMAAFVLVVVCVPLIGLEGAWTLLLVPALLAAAFAMREAVRLRRSVTRGARREP